jgi:hypothetical protein
MSPQPDHRQERELHGLFGCVGIGGTVRIWPGGGCISNRRKQQQLYRLACGCNTGAVNGCYAIGDVRGSGAVGGLVGWNKGGTILTCHVIGTVEGTESLGNLVGLNSDSGAILACYSVGDVMGYYAVGGLVGQNDSGTIAECRAPSPSRETLTSAPCGAQYGGDDSSLLRPPAPTDGR